jgi:hypothetical protein
VCGQSQSDAAGELRVVTPKSDTSERTLPLLGLVAAALKRTARARTTNARRPA